MRYLFWALSATAVVLFAVLVFMFISPKEDTPKDFKKQNSDNTIVLKFAHNTPIDSALNAAAMRFAKEVFRKSGGKVKVEVYPSQKLGNDHKMLELARAGKIDILLTPTAKMSISIPAMQYADLPFFFPTREDLYEMLDGEPGQILLNKLKSIDLVGVTFWENGFKHFSANAPLLAPADFENKKIRIMKSRIIKEQFKDFGAKPVVIDFFSTKKALADGVVDGQENPLVAFYSMGFYEVQKNLTLSEHAYLGYVFSISAKTFDMLPHNIRKMLVETAKEITPWEREKTKENEKELLQKIEASGVNVHVMTQSERQLFENAVLGIVQKYEDVIGSDIISKTQELLLEKYLPKNIWTVGLDVDLSVDEYKSGLAIKRGIELAIEKINKNGGLLGKKVVLITKDNKASPSKGVENIKAFLKRDDLIAVIGGKKSHVVVKELRLMEAAKKPFFIPWASAKDLTQNGYKENYVFRISANNANASKFIVNQALNKYKRIAIMAENTLFGKGNVENMEKCLAKRGIKFVSVNVFNRGQSSFAHEVENLVKTKADCLILIANAQEASKILRAIYEHDRKIAVYSHWSIIGGEFFKNTKDILDKINMKVFQTFSFKHNDNEYAQRLEKNYLAKYGREDYHKITAANGVAQAYDIMSILAKAVNNANSVDGIKLKESLENIQNYDGVLKDYDTVFTKENHDALNMNDYFMVNIKEELR